MATMDRDLMMDVYREQTTQGRHIEGQRLEVTKFILASAAALLGVMGALKFSIHCLPLAVALVYLGVFGRRLTAIYVARFEGHMDRARAIRQEIDTNLQQGMLQVILDAHPVVKAERVRTFWTRIHRAIVIFGMICVTWTIAAVSARALVQTGPIHRRILDQLAFVDLADPPLRH